MNGLIFMKNNIEEKTVEKNNFYSFLKVRIGCMHIYVCVYIYMCVCVYIYIHIYIYDEFGTKRDGPCAHVVYGAIEKKIIKTLHY